MYLCDLVCTCVCVCVCICACLYLCGCVCEYLCICVLCIHMCACGCLYVLMCVTVCVPLSVCVCVCAFVYVHVCGYVCVCSSLPSGALRRRLFWPSWRLSVRGRLCVLSWWPWCCSPCWSEWHSRLVSGCLPSPPESRMSPAGTPVILQSRSLSEPTLTTGIQLVSLHITLGIQCPNLTNSISAHIFSERIGCKAKADWKAYCQLGSIPFWFGPLVRIPSCLWCLKTESVLNSSNLVISCVINPHAPYTNIHTHTYTHTHTHTHRHTHTQKTHTHTPTPQTGTKGLWWHYCDVN